MRQDRNRSAGGIFTVKDGNLVSMGEQPFAAEKVLQRLLADYPGLLAGDQRDDEEGPRRWLLVTREMQVPAEEDGAGRWSLDHLFLDQEGVPTLVEVKRSSDSRIRREVVGQMLDYAANSVVYWPVESIRSRFESRCQDEGKDAEAELGGLLGNEANPEQFWQRVKTNIQAGRVRLVFVADAIPPELRRIVEFLNEQMDPAEVLALEVKKYGPEQQQVLVARLVGQTAEAERKKRTGAASTTKWTEHLYFSSLPEAYQPIVRRLQEWAKQNAVQTSWGGQKFGAFYLLLGEDPQRFIVVRSKGADSVIRVTVGALADLPGFQDESMREELRGRLNGIPQVQVDPGALSPGIPVAIFQDGERLDQFLSCLDWVVQRVRKSAEAAAI